MPRLSPHRIADAVRRIDPVFLGTPQSLDARLSAWLDCDLVIKDECATPVRCFKGRGASHYVESLEAPQPLACASAGNFGLGLAHACARRGVPLTVFVSRHANPVKVAAIRALGARVETAGDDLDAAKDVARRFPARFVEDGRDLAISEGAGTLAVELLDAFAPDAIVLPLGNGALLAGVGAWFRHRSPRTRVIGVVAAGAPAMQRAWRGESTHDCRADTVADGIAVRVPVPEAVADLAPLLDDVLAVDDDALRLAQHEVAARCGRRVEPSAVAGLAALHVHRHRFRGQCIATAFTGANVPET